MKSANKNIFKAFIFVILFFSVGLCIYSIWNYNSTENINIGKYNIGQQSQTQNQQAGPQGGLMQASASSTNISISSLLIIYSVGFFLIAALSYYIFCYRKVKIPKINIKLLLAILLSVGFLLHIFAATLMRGYSGDIALFSSWASSAAKNLTTFYSSSNSSDYPPLYIYVLAFVGKLSSITLLSKYSILLLKLPSILADIASSYIIYKIAKKYLSKEISILLCAFYLFNPAIFINSTLWGQVDSFFTLIIIFSVYFLSEKKVGLSTVCFIAAVLMKPQGIIFLPILFFEIVRQKSIKTFLKATAVAAITFIVIIIPFSLNQNAFWIIKLYSGTVGEYTYASMNAFNFYSLIGANFVNYGTTLLGLSYHTWGIIFIILITAFSWFIYIEGNDSKFAFAAALIQISGVFTFSVAMHERYLFPSVAMAVLAFIYIRDRRFLLLALGFSITSYINMHAVLFGAFNGSSNTVTTSPAVIVSSLINVLLFAYLIKVVFDLAMKKRKNA